MSAALRTACALLALTLAGCASAPVTLVALPAPDAAVQAGQHAGITVRVREVKIPGYLESYPIVIGRSDNSLVFARNAEWAERLSEGVARVLRDALSRRLGTTRVLVPGERHLADADLTTEFLALEPQWGALHLDARFTVSCIATGASRSGRIRLQVPMREITPSAVAASTTEALARFADGLAAELRC